MKTVKSSFTKIFLIILLTSFILQCGKEGETKHYKYIANAEWSPISGQTLLVSKDEYDETTGKTSGCGNEVYDLNLRGPSYKIFLTDTSGNVKKQITETGFVPPFQMKWSPKGDKFLVWGENFFKLWIIDTIGSTLTTDSLIYIRDADWSPDGSYIICSAVRLLSNYPHLYLVSSANASVSQLLPDSIQTGAVSWSKNNQIAFAYTSTNKTTLATMNPDGSNLQNLDDGGYFNTVKWSPDGNVILYSKRISTSYNAYLMEASTKDTLRILEFKDSTSIASMRFSPDGTMISYYVYSSSGQFSLYIRDIANWITYSIAQQSTDGSWSPDSKSIVYVYYNEIYKRKLK